MQYLHWLRERIESSAKSFFPPDEFEIFKASIPLVEQEPHRLASVDLSPHQERFKDKIASEFFITVRQRINGHPHPYLQTADGEQDLYARFSAVYDDYYFRRYGGRP